MLAGRREPSGRAGLLPRRPPPGAAQLEMKIHLDKNLEEERQLLLQQQRLCRSRARRYFVESNRRKKAFEEKRKEQEEREHQLREQILQQRKQKFEEVTEKFQRSHVPLSQRRRTAFQRTVPPLEEALKQIQDSSLKAEANPPSSHRPARNWRAVGNASPSSLLKSDPPRQKPLLPDPSCGGAVKETRRGHLAAGDCVFQLKLEETRKLLEEQRLSSLQKFCQEVNQITNSETLSSVDSLEGGAHEEPYFLLGKAPSAAVLKSPGSPGPADPQSAPVGCCQDKLLFAKAQHLSTWLGSLEQPSVQDGRPFSGVPRPPSREGFHSKEENPPVPKRAAGGATSPAGNSVSFVYSPPTCGWESKTSSSETRGVRTGFTLERPLVAKSPNLNLRKAWTAAEPLPRDVAPLSGLSPDSRAPPHGPAARPLLLASGAQPARPSLKESGLADTGQCSFHFGERKDVQEEGPDVPCPQRELPFFSEVLPDAPAPRYSGSADGQRMAGPLSPDAISGHDSVGQHKRTQFSLPERSRMRLLKSILKKDSNYEHDCFKALVLNQGVRLGNKKAAAIRDSIELTKEKGKSVEIPKTVKRLRWFDETGDPGGAGRNADRNEALRNRIDLLSPARSRPFSPETVSESPANVIPVPACTVSSADMETPEHDSVSENVTSLEGFGTAQVPSKCFFPPGYTLANQAWLAPEKEGSHCPVQPGGPRRQKGVLQRGGVKVARRPRPAKAPPGFLRTTRKGVIIRSQPANKAMTFLQAQSQLTSPHPPPQPPSSSSGSKNAHVSQCPSWMPEGSQNTVAQNQFNSRQVLPAEQELSLWNQRRGPPLSEASAGSVTGAPSPSRCPECQTLAAGAHVSGPPEGTQRDETDCCARGRPETVSLWKGQCELWGRNKEAAESTVTTRKRMTGNKRRILLAQKRQNPGRADQRFRGQANNVAPTMQRSSSEPKQAARGSSGEPVSESTSEFLMAENLVKASVAEDKILSILNCRPGWKAAPGLKETRPLNVCALSAEEQAILRSLESLNERLHYLQEIICKNPSIKNTFKIIPTLVSHPGTNLSPDVGSSLQREYR